MIKFSHLINADIVLFLDDIYTMLSNEINKRKLIID